MDKLMKQNIVKMKTKATNRMAVLLVMLLAAVAVQARDYRPDDIHNPNTENRMVYVADPGNLVSLAAKDRANKTLWQLRQKTGAEVAVAVVPSIGDMPPEEFAEKVFTSWGLGKKDKDNGVLVLIVPGQRVARIQTGYGVEGIITDVGAKHIINSTVTAHMREKDLDGAVTSVASRIAGVLSDPEAAAELKSQSKEAWEQEEVPPVTADDIMTFAGWVALAMLLVAAVMFFIDWRDTRRRDRFGRAVHWRRHRWLYWTLAVLSAGLAIPVALLAEFKYRRARNKPMVCGVCGHKMRKLGEKEDNAMLSPSQDLEERLGTVDYDVWVCPECGAVERYPFREKQLKYSECPRCHTVAMCLVQDHTLQPATVRHTGTGEKVYECQYCRNQKRHRYVIPKKEDLAAAALAAGAIAGSRRGGGGGFGGGFGGGSTGGGGATGRW